MYMTKERSRLAHEKLSNGEYEEAYVIYRRLTESSDTSNEQIKVAYQNGGACLRKLGRVDESIAFLEKGLVHFPDAGGIHHNLGNALKEKGDDLRWKALSHYRRALSLGTASAQLVFSCASLWDELGCPLQAYLCCTKWLDGKPASIPPEIVQLLLELSTKLFSRQEAEPLAMWCAKELRNATATGAINRLCYAAIICRLGHTEEACEVYKSVRDELGSRTSVIEEQESTKLVISLWNLSCSLLKAGELQAGWELYEYGLRAPAKGHQEWQRALPKLFHKDEVPLWKGQDLRGKRVLVLGEQAIGDTMMFLQLLPWMLKKEAALTLAIQERLVPVYSRTYSSIKVHGVDNDVDSILCKADFCSEEFDFQIPCGSLPQHCLQEWLSMTGRERCLSVDRSYTEELRSRYREDLPTMTPVIGISWQGGGKKDRIRSKSMPGEEFERLLRSLSARFVSLQYGNTSAQVERWRASGLDIVLDDEIDALANLDKWLAQVAACDLVISIANTTIHGSGALGVPTLCIQSRNSDWRWVEGMKHSYWYNSVDTVVQNSTGGWSSVISEAKTWTTSQWPKQKRVTRSQKGLSFKSIH